MNSSLYDTWHSFSFASTKRLPIILQATPVECGLACLAMLLNFYGHKTDINFLRRKKTVSLKGMTLQQLIKISEKLNFSTRAIRTELEELSDLNAPCILHWNLNHFVVLKKVYKNKIVIHDPAEGVINFSFEEASKHYTGIALEVSPNAEFEKSQFVQRVSLKEMIGKVSGIFSSCYKVIVLAIVAQVFMLISPLFIQWVVDGALVSGQKSLLTGIAIGFLLLAIIHGLVIAIRSWTVLFITTQIKLQWSMNIFNHLIKLPVLYFEQRQLGDVASRFNSIEVIQRMVTTTFVEAFLDGFLVVIVLFAMWFYSPLLTSIVIAAALFYAVIRIFFDSSLRAAIKENILFSARRTSHFLETLRVMQSLKLFGRENERTMRWNNLHVDTLNRDVKIQKIRIIIQSSNFLIFSVESVLTIWVGAFLVLNSGFSVGMLFAFIAYRNYFSARIGKLIDLIMDVRALSLHGERLADIVYTRKEVDEGIFETNKDDVKAVLEVKNLGFRYEDDDPLILKNCSFKILEGESVAIIGASGCGKTTLMKLLLGLLSPSKGEVLIDGINIQNFGLRGYRDLIGTVMQDDQLLAGSIAENINFFSHDMDYKKIEYSAKKAAIHDDIMKMPMTYNTLVGEIGSTLSGGQRQRIMLARALYKNPKILFLDEATSHLDSETENLVNKAIKEISLTKIIIAHRQESINSADRVICIKDGSIEFDEYNSNKMKKIQLNNFG